VAVIDCLFTPGTLEHPNLQFTDGHEGSMLTVVELVERIPDELITVDADLYCGLLAGLNTMRTAISRWRGGHSHIFRYVPGYGVDPITLIRGVLVKCPDKFPAPHTTELTFIQPSDFRESLRIDLSAANRALTNAEWKAATIIAGSVIEALLLWALQQEDSVKVMTAINTLLSNGVLKQRAHTDLERWNLHEYLEVAAEIGVIRAETADQARLAKDFRNLIHPGRAARLGQACNRGTALSAMAAVEHVVQDLTP
jgi:hypothetical protein